MQIGTDPPGRPSAAGPTGPLSGSYGYAYDVRGRDEQTTLTVGGTSYPIQTTYNDADQVLSETYPDR
jgi:hypothetical protein